MKVIVERRVKWDIYLGDVDKPLASVLNNVLSFTILFNYVVPISLYVTLGN